MKLGRTGKDVRQFADGPEHLPHEPVRAAQRRVDLGAHANEPAGHRELELVRLCMQRDDARVDRLAPVAPRAVLCDDAGPYLDFHPEAQHPREDRAARHAALELVDLRAWLVHVERADHDQSRVRGKVAHGDRDALNDVLVHGVDVVLELRRDGHDGRHLCHRT